MRPALKLWYLLLCIPANIFSAAEQYKPIYRLEKRLENAIKRNDPLAVQALVENGARIDHKDEQGKDILIHACEGTNPNIITYLLAKKATAHTISNEGKTPLIYALENARLTGSPSLLFAAIKRAEMQSSKGLLSLNCAKFLGAVKLQEEINRIAVARKRKLESFNKEAEPLPAPLPAIRREKIGEKRKTTCGGFSPHLDSATCAKKSNESEELTSVISALSSLQVTSFSKDLILSGKILRPIAKRP